MRYNLEKTNSSNEFDFCWLVNSDQGPGPANIVLTFQNKIPFKVCKKKKNFTLFI